MHPALIKNFQRAIQLQQKGDLDGAAAACQSVIDQVPNEPDPLHLLGLIRKQQGQLDEAERLMRISIEKAPDRANFLGNLGNLLSNSGRIADAEQAYRRALLLDNRFRPARLGLARLLNSAGIFDAAEEEAQTLLHANPKDTEALAISAEALTGLSRFPDAETAYRKALQISPTYSLARHNLGALLARTERIEEALVELDTAKRDGARGAILDFNRASAMLKLYRFEEGEALLNATVQREPAYAEAQKLLAQYRFMRGSEDFSAEIADAAGRFADHADLQLAYAQVLHGANQLEAAEAALQIALKFCNRNSRLLGLLASVYQESGNYEAALSASREAVTSAPDDPLLSDYVIDALLSLGRAAEAMPLILAGRDRLPYNQWYIATEATACRLQGDLRYNVLCDYDEMVRVYELEPPDGWETIEAFHEDLLPALRERHQFYAHPLDQSLRSGTQTPRNLIGDQNPFIQAFIAAVQKPITEYRASIGFAGGHPLRERNRGEAQLSGCWSVRLQRGGFHVNHIHPEGWISSAYYVEVPREVEDELARPGWIKFGEPRYPVPDATAERMVRPKPGRLVLFPSYLWHGTMPISGSEPRMTMAFDAITKPDS